MQPAPQPGTVTTSIEEFVGAIHPLVTDWLDSGERKHRAVLEARDKRHEREVALEQKGMELEADDSRGDRRTYGIGGLVLLGVLVGAYTLLAATGHASEATGVLTFLGGSGVGGVGGFILGRRKQLALHGRAPADMLEDEE